ncbi:MAG: PD-(D/E)XK nuclease family protein [Bacteroidetes bacterium]|nr:PD-(D/E)XK nuclease family protein [Bacteroidota bacterium]
MIRDKHVQELIQELKSLKSSPLFNFSLSSKELFHSNFLAWLFEQEELKGLVTEFFRTSLPPEVSHFVFDPVMKDAVQREKQNIDLWLKFHDPNLQGTDRESGMWHVWIENKVKSLPRMEQLEKYQEKRPENSTCILLSLSEFEQPMPDWQKMTFQEVLALINQCIAITSDDYTRLILADYVILVKVLLKVDEQAQINQSELFDFWSVHSDPLLRTLDDLRLDDFYLKKKYAGLAFEAWNQLNYQEFEVAPFRTAIDWQASSPTVFVNSGMTRATGFLDFKYVIAPDLSIGIQIQGNAYRMVVEDNTGKRTRALAQNLLEKKMWFDFSPALDASERYPKRKSFNQFGPVFLYQSKKIPSNMKWRQVLSICETNLRYVLQHRHQLLAFLDCE